ncbi:hypothetical protein FCH28_18745 [Streptomyces piniterrae]|uniref:Uncharacterized protein n=1 Tax=Streptomyces piniterrae TaxID=2571125 RepID=A0A4U0NCZ9_9ACTN|nr:hypothetical protein [Streptomyces piniterrae]TJZ51901.1 hypothetical protein FCH28_18745 [Streptomyces piniterrae]
MSSQRPAKGQAVGPAQGGGPGTGDSELIEIHGTFASRVPAEGGGPVRGSVSDCAAGWPGLMAVPGRG